MGSLTCMPSVDAAAMHAIRRSVCCTALASAAAPETLQMGDISVDAIDVLFLRCLYSCLGCHAMLQNILLSCSSQAVLTDCMADRPETSAEKRLQMPRELPKISCGEQSSSCCPLLLHYRHCRAQANSDACAWLPSARFLTMHMMWMPCMLMIFGCSLLVQERVRVDGKAAKGTLSQASCQGRALL